ncbi:MAG: hypothetical protein IH931_04855 [candidate division Zixibacteria bacterium]|nr:hypothetical protein [candidate division Zixibacteria bacterium]
MIDKHLGRIAAVMLALKAQSLIACGALAAQRSTRIAWLTIIGLPCLFTETDLKH